MKKIITIALCGLMIFSGCSNMSKLGKGTLIGTGAGAAAKNNLKTFAEKMKDLPETQITVFGHTDNTGTAVSRSTSALPKRWSRLSRTEPSQNSPQKF